MGKFDGKKLLILGTSVASVDIVQYAKAEGAYVIVTDYLTTEKSAAKQYADETAMISTLDTDALCEFVINRQIDGVFCGVSEPNLLSVNEIASRTGLPCYFSRKQWDAIENKTKFKELCEQFHVPVAKQYDVSAFSEEQEINRLPFPVIVKPADRSASIGVHICNDPEEFISGYKDAYDKSFSHQVIVEEYLDGIQFSASYSIINGVCRLSTLTDGYQNCEQKGVPPVLEASILPSRHLDYYIKEVNGHVVDMIDSLHIDTGIIFIQGKTNGKRIAVFEGGLRISASELYKVVSRTNGINMMHILVDYAVLGRAEGNIELEDPFLRGKKVCLLYILGKEGKIHRIKGIQEINNLDGVIRVDVHYKEGQRISGIGTQKQRVIRVYVMGDSKEELRKTIAHVQRLITVEDSDGKSLLLPPLDSEKLIV